MSPRLMERPTDTAFMEIAILLFANWRALANGFHAPSWQEAAGTLRMELGQNCVGHYASGLPTFLSP